MLAFKAVVSKMIVDGIGEVPAEKLVEAYLICRNCEKEVGVVLLFASPLFPAPRPMVGHHSRDHDAVAAHHEYVQPHRLPDGTLIHAFQCRARRGCGWRGSATDDSIVYGLLHAPRPALGQLHLKLGDDIKLGTA
jgi:hypothetical protein